MSLDRVPLEDHLLSNSAVARKLSLFASRAEQAIFVGGADGRVEWANEAACRLSGWSDAEILGRRIVLFPDDPDAEREAQQHIQRRFSAGERARVEAAVRDRAGRSLWVALEVVPIPDPGGAAPGWVAIASDVSERKRQEAVLAESERRYRSMVEGSPDAVAVHSEGRLVYVNRAALDLLGARSAAVVLGRPVFDFVHPGDQQRVAERILKIELAGDAVAPVRERLLRVDGSSVDVIVAATPIVWRAAPAIQLVGHAIFCDADARRARAVFASTDLSALMVELLPVIEERIAPRARVAVDLCGTPVVVAADRRRLASVIETLVGRVAAVFPDGCAGIRLTTGARELDAPGLAAWRISEAARPGRYVVLELRAQAEPGGRPPRAGERAAERPPRRPLRLAEAHALIRACGGVLGVESEAGLRVRILVGFPAPAAAS